MRTNFLIIATLAASVLPPSTFAAVAISGRPVPEMAVFDNRMKNYLEANSIGAGVLGIMRQDRIVYLRGFGILQGGIDLPENATFRVASLSKPITAAAIRMMAADGAFGPLGIERKVFNLTIFNVNNGGLLSITPWQNLGDAEFANITIHHLLDHKGGFDVPDGIFHADSRRIANDMGLNASPSRLDRIRWMLHQSLPYSPGTEFHYSNFGFLVLGHIVETLGGGYLNFVRRRVLTAADGVPASEIEHGRTLIGARRSREPVYPNGGFGESVFDYGLPPYQILPNAYGGDFDMEALLGPASIVASAPAMLNFARRFRVWYPSAGVPYTGNGDDAIHDGGLASLNTRLVSRSDGVVVYIALNVENTVGGAYGQIASVLDAGPGANFTWPATTSDGHWITVPEGNPTAGYGGYHAPWQGFGSALAKADDASRLRLKAGSSNWTGKIKKRLKLDAPEGTVRIGLNP